MRSRVGIDWIAVARISETACASAKPLAGASMGTNSKLAFCATFIMTCCSLALGAALTSHTLLPGA